MLHNFMTNREIIDWLYYHFSREKGKNNWQEMTRFFENKVLNSYYENSRN